VGGVIESLPSMFNERRAAARAAVLRDDVFDAHPRRIFLSRVRRDTFFDAHEGRPGKL